MADLPKKCESGIITSTDRIAPNSSRSNLTLYADKEAKKAGVVLDKATGKASFPSGIHIPNEVSEYIDASVKNHMPPLSWGSWEISPSDLSDGIKVIDLNGAMLTKIGPMVNIIISLNIEVIKKAAGFILNLPFKKKFIGSYELIGKSGELKSIPIEDGSKEIRILLNQKYFPGNPERDGIFRTEIQIKSFYQTDE